MYGLVNKAIKDLVVSNHGESVWQEICERADFLEQDFIGMNPYPDKLTFDLVKHTSDVLSVEQSVVLELFGEYWILYTAREGYGDLLDLTGSTFVEFLDNLDMLHYRINNLMPQLEAPQFRARNKTENSVELEYHSNRVGMIPMLIGLIRGLGRRFELEVTTEQIQFKAQGDACDVFKITW
jgi:hypothetical protein